MKQTPVILLATLAFALAGMLCGADEAPIPLPRAHAHNDYLHERPLLDALEHGFCSIEADVWLVDGQLLVAHDRDQVDPARTLQGLYLDPLLERVRRNGGRVYPGGPEVILLVDIKSEGKATYGVLRSLLAKYEEMVSTYTAQGFNERSVRVIVSGNRPRSIMQRETLHYAGYDGRLRDLDSDASAAFIPLISGAWPSTFTWNGQGPMPKDERKTLRDIVARAHAKGRKVRFWAIPDNPEFYDQLLKAGVDLINADNLPGLRDYLLRKS